MQADQIIVRNVHKSFGETIALNGCSFAAAPGEIHAIVGENGSGKSTLAKMLSGVLRPDSGDLSVFGGVPVSPIAARRLGVATIFQEVLVADEASVTANLFVGADGLWSRLASVAPRRRQAAEIMRRFIGMDIDPDALAGQFPLSVKQWIVIGRAILSKPRLLILDESSAALDLDATIRLHHEIKELRDQGVCILIVTHRIAELVKIADRATVLRDGETVGNLEKSEITETNLMALMTPQHRVRSAQSSGRSNLNSRAGLPVLRANGLRLTKTADPFDFALGQGEVVGLTGLDGQGQDHFIKALAGIQPPQAGVPTMNADGRDLAVRSLGDADRLGIAYVSGDRKREGIFPDMGIFENLALGLYKRHLAWGGWLNLRPIEAAFKMEVARFSIKTGDRSNMITSLSGGNQQKVLIGRAFAAAPRVILLNDPARGVDLGTKRDLYGELRRFADQGGAVVYLTTEIEELIGFVDRVDVFRNDSLFRSLSGDDVDELPMLAAMFGHAPSETILFEDTEAA